MTQRRKTSFEIQAILDELRDIYVKTPRDQVFRDHLDRLLKCDEHDVPLPCPVTFTRTGETRGIALVDGPGGGKTSLVKHNLLRHPAFANPRANTTPIVAASVPSPATLKSLALEIIRETGFPAPSSRTSAWELWRLVRVRLACCGAVVLWIDEAHDLFRKRSTSEVEDMLRMLKSLMLGDGAVIVILTGVDALWRIASCDDQVKRRYSKIELPPISNVRDGKALARQIAIFCERAGMAPPTEPDLIPRLIFASRERFGRCIENIIHAIELALKDGADQLDMQHFAEAWTMQEERGFRENVFLAPDWSRIDLAAAAPA